MERNHAQESADAAISHMCGIVESMIAENDRSAGALSALESMCKALGMLCATSGASPEMCASGFAVQVRGLASAHGTTNTDC